MTNNTRYNNGKIYKIINNFNDMVYIGSTCGTTSPHDTLDWREARRHGGALACVDYIILGCLMTVLARKL